jgi:hypothetical protein
MYTLYFFIPFIFIKKYKLNKLLFTILIFLFIFTIIGFLRGDLGEIINPIDAISILGFYIYPNFINFESLVHEGDPTSHIYTLQFLLKPALQLFDFNVTPPQSAIGAFNVATALNPLYQDGGILNIFITTTVIGYLLQRLEGSSSNGVLSIFWRSTLLLVVVFFHNGWLLLNFMPTYNTILYLLIILGITSLRSSRVKSHPASV